MKILAIETSCDETAMAVLEFKRVPSRFGQSEAGGFRILSNIVASSVELQAKYGGIVPEIAARKQMEYIIFVLGDALKQTNSELNPRSSRGQNSKLWNSFDYIAVTNGPGLITSLRVGVEAARTLSYIWGKPLVAVNHLEGHIYSAMLNKLKTQFPIQSGTKLKTMEGIKFPALALIVSGGHTQLVVMNDYLKYKIIGETLDDAVGEAFDKVAKILGLGYPGGPVISKLAEKGNREAIKLPRPMIDSGDYNFSFPGLKTSVLYYSLKHKSIKALKQKQDLCAGFEQACVDVLVKKTIRAAKQFKIKTVLLGGGVAANQELREQLERALKQKAPGCYFLAPEIEWTGDNAAMIALAGYYKIRAKRFSDWRKIKVEANLRLDQKLVISDKLSG